MTKKRQVSLKPSRVHRSRENINSAKNKSNISAHENPIELSAIREEENDGAVKQWLAERLRDKLQRASILSFHNHKPILLYRKSIEETENATEEEISLCIRKSDCPYDICIRWIYSFIISSH